MKCPDCNKQMMHIKKYDGLRDEYECSTHGIFVDGCEEETVVPAYDPMDSEYERAWDLKYNQA